MIKFVCPITNDPVRRVSLDELNSLVADRATIKEGVTGAYISDSAKFAFPTEGEIHVFLQSEAIPLVGAQAADTYTLAEPKNESVRKWYDTFGWVKNENDIYNDAAIYAPQELNAAGRHSLLAHLSLAERLGQGKAILDAASGAIAAIEYLHYSRFFERRVCVDFSKVALLEAQQKLGSRGLYVLADICHLPFAADSFDAVISQYTLQHIDESDQEVAVRELYRVVRPEKHLVIIGDSGSPVMRISHRVINKLVRMWSLIRKSAVVSGSTVSSSSDAKKPVPPYKLYGRNRPISWWKSLTASLEGNTRIECFRLLSKEEITSWFGHNSDRIRWLRGLEILCPRLLAPFSFYLLIDIRKSVRDQLD